MELRNTELSNKAEFEKCVQTRAQSFGSGLVDKNLRVIQKQCAEQTNIVLDDYLRKNESTGLKFRRSKRDLWSFVNALNPFKKNQVYPQTQESNHKPFNTLIGRKIHPIIQKGFEGYNVVSGGVSAKSKKLFSQKAKKIGSKYIANRHTSKRYVNRNLLEQQSLSFQTHKPKSSRTSRASSKTRVYRTSKKLKKSEIPQRIQRELKKNNRMTRKK